MAASAFHVEAASSCVHGRAGREVLPEWRSGNDASCPASGTPPVPTAIPQRQSPGRHRLASTKQRLLKTGAQLRGGKGEEGLPPHGRGNRIAFRQVFRDFHGRWLQGGRQLSFSPASGAAPFTSWSNSANTTNATDIMVPDERRARNFPLLTRGLLAWVFAEGRDAVARVAAAVTEAPLCLRAPAALRSWLAVFAAAAACVAGALLVSRLSLAATSPFALAMGLMGDFGDVGPRRRVPGLQPAIKKQKAIEMEGQVQKALPNAMFQVSLDNGCQVLAHISGKIRRNRIEIFQGDRVKVEISPYDLTRGRITHRNRRAGQGGPAPPGGPPGGPSTPGAPAPA